MKINKSRNKQKKTRQLCLSILFMFMLCVMISVTPVTAATVDCDQILSTMKDLRLSTDQLEVEQGEIYQFEVLPTEFGWSFGWRISQVNFSDPDICVVHQTLPIGTKVKVAGTDQEFEISAQDQIANANSDDIDQRNNQRLKFYIEAKKTGNVKFKVLLANPSWEAGCTHGHACNLSLICDIAAVPQGTKAARLNVASNLFSDVQLSNSSLTLPSGQPDLNPDLVLPPVNDDNTSKPSKPGSQPDQQPDDSEQPDDPEQPDQQPDDPEQPDEPSQPDNQPGATDPTPEPPTTPINPGDGTEDNKDPELVEYDTTDWLPTGDALLLTYNGKEQYPSLNLPDGVKANITGIGTDAGEYTIDISYEVPAGAKPVPDMTLTYTIGQATPSVEYNFNPLTGMIEGQLNGVVSEDVVGDIATGITDANGSAVDAMTDPGYYHVTSQLWISEDKKHNYTTAELNKEEYFNVKSDQSWLNFALEYSEENGQLVVAVCIKDLNIPQVGGYDKVATGLKLFYDTERLEYAGQEDGDWTSTMDLMSMNRIVASYNGNLNSSSGPLPKDSVITYVKFNYKDPNGDHSDLIFRTGQVGGATNPQDICPDSAYGQSPQRDFYYKSGGQVVMVANPSGNINVTEVTVPGNPMADAFYKGQGDEDSAREYLQEYIDQNFTTPSMLEPTSEIAPADTMTTPVDTAQTVQETSPAAPAPEMNTQPAPTDVSNEIVSIDNNLAEANPTVSTSEVENTSEPSPESSSSSTSESVEPTPESTPESTPSADNSAEQFAA